MIEHVFAGDRIAGAHLLGGFERPPCWKDREATEQSSLRLGEQFVAPVDGRLERALARNRRAAPAGQQTETILQPSVDLVERQHVQPCSRQLDCERYSVETQADLGDRRDVAGGDSESSVDRQGTVHEQPRGFELEQRLQLNRLGGIGHGE